MLLLGETNSVLTALLPKPASVPVFHMEVGNCCYDDRVPWERIFVTGNFIFGVLTHNAARIEKSDVHARLGLRLASTFS